MNVGPRVQWLAAGVVLLLVAGGLAVALHDDDSIAPGAARADVEGEATVVADGVEEPLEDGDSVARGAEVVVSSGTVVLRLANGTTLEGRQGRAGADPTRVVVDQVPELLGGDLLVVGSDVAIDAGAATVHVPPSDPPAAVRIRRALSVTTASYVGEIEIDSAGQARAMPALRQLTVASLGRLPRVPEPLIYDEADPWDLRFLGAAMELGRRLDALSRAYSSIVSAGQASTASFFTSVLPVLEEFPEFSDGDLFDPARESGETLVGAAIAALGDRGTFARRWNSVFELRDDGARWGLVAADQDVTDAPVLAEVEQALSRTTELDEEATTGTGGGPGGAATTTSPSSTSTTTGGGATPPPTTAPPGSVPPPTDPDLLPDTGVPLIDDVAQPVENLLGGLLGRG